MKPICVHCGKPYGRRDVSTEVVRWDTPIKEIGVRHNVRGPTKDAVYGPDGPIAPPPPYRGNGRVAKEGHAYLSADDNRMVMHRYIWDGESYTGGYKPFCTLTCALAYARQAYSRERARKLEKTR